MSRTVEVTLSDGGLVKVYGYTRVHDHVLTVVETYGDGTGTKEVRHYPLVNVRSWKETGG